MKDSFNPTFILGVRVDTVSLDELLDYTFCVIRDHKKAVITNVNIHAINLAQELEWFTNFINQSQIVFCDGFGVKWAARFLHGSELYRFTPPDWFGQLAEMCADRGFSLFFIGAHQAVVEKAAVVMKEKYPALNIVGTQHGYFDKSITNPDNQLIVDRINRLQPDILVVGFGMPAQEKWISENWDNLSVHVALPVGAFFDYVTGDVQRAPGWMTNHGFEWLGRLAIEPRRLWKRYVYGNPLFLWRILLQKLKIRKYNLPSS